MKKQQNLLAPLITAVWIIGLAAAGNAVEVEYVGRTWTYEQPNQVGLKGLIMNEDNAHIYGHSFRSVGKIEWYTSTDKPHVLKKSGHVFIPDSSCMLQEVFLSPDGKYLYGFHNGKVGKKKAGVNVYSRNKADGALTHKSCIEWERSIANYPDYAMAPDGEKFVVLNRYGRDGGNVVELATFLRNKETGVLTPGKTIECGPGDAEIKHHLCFSPDGKHLYISVDYVEFSREKKKKIGMGTFRVDMYWYAWDAVSGTLSPGGVLTDDPRISRLNNFTFTPDGGMLYVMDAAKGVTWYARNKATGALTFTGTSDNTFLKAIRFLLFNSDGSHVLASGGSSYGFIRWLDRNKTTGALTAVGEINQNDDPRQGLTFTGPRFLKVVDGRHLYCDAIWQENGGTKSAIGVWNITDDWWEGEGAVGTRGQIAGIIPETSYAGMSKNGVFLTVARTGNYVYSLYDMAGRLMLGEDLGGLVPGSHRVLFGNNQAPASGTYILRLEKDGAMEWQSAVGMR